MVVLWIRWYGWWICVKLFVFCLLVSWWRNSVLYVCVVHEPFYRFKNGVLKWLWGNSVVCSTMCVKSPFIMCVCKLVCKRYACEFWRCCDEFGSVRIGLWFRWQFGNDYVNGMLLWYAVGSWPIGFVEYLDWIGNLWGNSVGLSNWCVNPPFAGYVMSSWLLEACKLCLCLWWIRLSSCVRNCVVQIGKKKTSGVELFTEFLLSAWGRLCGSVTVLA